MSQGNGTIATILPESDNGQELSIVETPAPTTQEVDWKLEQAREHLVTLRRKQDELERQKSDLEELRRKQDEYTRGKAEMIDALTRGLVTLDSEQIKAQRLAELSANSSAAFRNYLEQLQAINDEAWTTETVRPELSKALGVIENSRLEFNRARTKLDCLNPAANDHVVPVTEKARAETVSGPELMRWVCIGAAASAPLIMSGTIWLIIALVFRR